MFGFSALLNNKCGFQFKTIGTSGRKMQSADYVCYNNMIDKFESDKVFIEDENYMLIIDGVILNKNELVAQTHRNWPFVILKADDLRGG